MPSGGKFALAEVFGKKKIEEAESRERHATMSPENACAVHVSLLQSRHGVLPVLLGSETLILRESPCVSALRARVNIYTAGLLKLADTLAHRTRSESGDGDERSWESNRPRLNSGHKIGNKPG